jgi:hypothetical protein
MAIELLEFPPVMNSRGASARFPASAYCDERHRLLREFSEGVRDLGLLLIQQSAALVNGYEDFTRFDILIRMANDRMANARDAYFAHVEMHGCSDSEMK